MSAPKDKNVLVVYWTQRCRELLQLRNNLTREDLEYVAQKAATLRDPRLQECIGSLIGWGDDERAELETFCAIAIELLKMTTPSKVREASRIVELRYHLQIDRKAYDTVPE